MYFEGRRKRFHTNPSFVFDLVDLRGIKQSITDHVRLGRLLFDNPSLSFTHILHRRTQEIVSFKRVCDPSFLQSERHLTILIFNKGRMKAGVHVSRCNPLNSCSKVTFPISHHYHHVILQLGFARTILLSAADWSHAVSNLIKINVTLDDGSPTEETHPGSLLHICVQTCRSSKMTVDGCVI